MILADKSLWDKTISSGDPNGFDVTYADRAKKYVTECDRTIDTFILPYFVDEKTIRLRLPMVDSYGDARSREANSRGKPIPWNQQMMLNGGFQRLAICHEMLGDDPQRVAQLRHHRPHLDPVMSIRDDSLPGGWTRMLQVGLRP